MLLAHHDVHVAEDVLPQTISFHELLDSSGVRFEREERVVPVVLTFDLVGEPALAPLVPFLDLATFRGDELLDLAHLFREAGLVEARAEDERTLVGPHSLHPSSWSDCDPVSRTG